MRDAAGVKGLITTISLFFRKGCLMTQRNGELCV
ncbi:hypothetical protein amad1_19495 [Alteromonas mediterranea DE1]|uniref:Uncharacterized protein n=1 Tax=Alteromonas mediterranea 615 TaxID=1300253 RepID=S5ALA5_9ALTE|nr:hypothetical protein amad1_19495 [Alteromonas mediterranea DE1]AGP79616.1 hypothetical protein I633_20490 [Alteromonas mediterranea 615]AGP83655.1 hypothetical protein I533_18530 [Alteromonas mediterranea MED64]AGP87459.1 hypothetical protein I607_18455 [Alteromonas mediterranea U4]AGP91596.1 hypothetical protein I876_18830 [Alteromonas mediterranea U7]AGP95395.1 hypothetical protein I634_18595 [Alteromonas mediterranea U8]AGP99390.1 hypothetical protein I635_19485 [Alteromonas mediterrane